MRSGTDRLKRRLSMRASTCLTSFAAVLLVMVILLVAKGYEPFGGDTLATADARIQYLDFLNFYKDVLEGKNSIYYSFSNGLGSNTIGLFSYYLASPLNLIVFFIPKTQINSFVDLLICVKLALGGASFAWFLQSRFRDRLQGIFVLLLSAGYGLMQYGISCGSNIMWLDGFIMLPLMLLGVYKVIRTDRIAPLAVPTGLSILFNWYSGGINCLFCILWCAFEFFLAESDRVERRRRKKSAVLPEEPAEELTEWDILFEKEEEEENSGPGSVFRRRLGGVLSRFTGTVIRYGLAMAMGVGISAVLFLPSAAMMRDGKGAGFYPELYMKNVLNGNLLSVITKYGFGEVSGKDAAALYCGSIAVIGCLCFFLYRRIGIGKKLAGAGILIVTLLTFYWQPLFFIFSLFKRADSYYFRYGYVGSMLLLFLAAYYLQAAFPSRRNAGAAQTETGQELSLLSGLEQYLPFLGAVLFVGISVIVRKQVFHESSVKEPALLCVLAAGVFLSALPVIRRKARKFIFVPALLLAVLSFAELAWNDSLLMEKFHTKDSGIFEQYADYGQKQSDKLKEYDAGIYRVSQIDQRDRKDNDLTACYNDALAYNYMGIGGYTSVPENDQMYLLDRMGYREEGSCMNIVNTSFTPADSVLGVKYVLSTEGIRGSTRVKEAEVTKGRLVYENPFCLPIAFLYSGEMLPKHEYHDPFTYAEEVWTVLAGEEAGLFKPAETVRKEEEGRITWTITSPAGRSSLYGNLVFAKEDGAEGESGSSAASSSAAGSSASGAAPAVTLTAGRSVPTAYNTWLAPSLFYVRYKKEDETIDVTLDHNTPVSIEEEQFYVLNLRRLEKLTEKIRARSEGRVSTDLMENGRMKFTVQAEQGESLFLSVSRTDGWTVKRNGEKIDTEEFAYCLTVIPLEEGQNVIEMEYKVPYLKEGVRVSAAAFLFVLIYEAAVTLAHYLRRRIAKVE